MDHSKGSGNGDYLSRPPPYSPQEYGQTSFTGMSYEVGNGSIAVVSPPGASDNMVHPVGPAALSAPYNPQCGDAPPMYSDDQHYSAFSDAAIRRGFIRKVYLTLLIQLLLTVGIICAFLYWETLNDWVSESSWFTYCMMGVVLVLIVALSCCDNLRRQVPLNFIALGLFTIAEGMMLGSLSVFFNAEAVLWAMGATALVSFSLSLFAIQSKALSETNAPPVKQIFTLKLQFLWDFTTVSGSLWVFAWTLFSFALLCAILRSQYLHITYACLGTLLFSLYLVFDTQLILGGKHRKYEVSPEEYIFAALNLYLDIVSLFLLLLQLIGLCR